MPGNIFILCRCGHHVRAGPATRFCEFCGNQVWDDLCGVSLNGGALRITHRIGAGGFALVYKAEHRRHGTIAVKVLRPEFADDEFVLGCWRTEVEANLRFKHLHKPRTWDSGEEMVGSGAGERVVHWLAMEFVEGYSLESYLTHLDEQGRLLRLDQLVDLMDQVLDVVVAAHDHHVVHRDLHPGNINLTVGAAGTVQARVLDFGISRLVDRPARANGDVLGRPQWMSPEQRDPSQSVDHRTDIFNLGLLLYRLLTGRHPFVDPTTGEYLEPEVHGAPIRPSRISPLSRKRVLKRFDRIVTRALRVRPHQRHRDARKLQKQLNSTLREPRSAWWILLVILAIVFGTGAALWLARPDLLSMIWSG